jgi:hypothetical protein
MCEPVTMAAIGSSVAGAATAATTAATTAAASSTFQMASLAISGAQAVAGAAANQDKANKHNAAVAQNNQSALDAYYLKSKQTNLREQQQLREASMQKQDADLKATKAQSTALVAAAGAGVKGSNVAQLIEDFERSEGILASRVDQKLEDTLKQNEMNKLGFQSEANNRINSMQPIGMSEQIFGIVEPLAGFGLDYFDSKSRLAAETE